MTNRPIRPTTSVIESYVRQFDTTAGYAIADNAVSRLFQTFRQNQRLEEVLLKVAVLNSLYNTSIYALQAVAEHILELQIDTKLASGSLALIDEIAKVKIGNKVRRNYSFATKYCGWHLPEIYPIYDSYVDNLLWEYQKVDNFAAFKRNQLLDYPNYKKLVEQFRSYYGLTQFRFKELDKFLWLYGKEFKGTS